MSSRSLRFFLLAALLTVPATSWAQLVPTHDLQRLLPDEELVGWDACSAVSVGASAFARRVRSGTGLEDMSCTVAQVTTAQLTPGPAWLQLWVTAEPTADALLLVQSPSAVLLAPCEGTSSPVCAAGRCVAELPPPDSRWHRVDPCVDAAEATTLDVRVVPAVGSSGELLIEEWSVEQSLPQEVDDRGHIQLAQLPPSPCLLVEPERERSALLLGDWTTTAGVTHCPALELPAVGVGPEPTWLVLAAHRPADSAASVDVLLQGPPGAILSDPSCPGAGLGLTCSGSSCTASWQVPAGEGWSTALGCVLTDDFAAVEIKLSTASPGGVLVGQVGLMAGKPDFTQFEQHAPLWADFGLLDLNLGAQLCGEAPLCFAELLAPYALQELTGTPLLRFETSSTDLVSALADWLLSWGDVADASVFTIETAHGTVNAVTLAMVEDEEAIAELGEALWSLPGGATTLASLEGAFGVESSAKVAVAVSQAEQCGGDQASCQALRATL